MNNEPTASNFLLREQVETLKSIRLVLWLTFWICLGVLAAAIALGICAERDRDARQFHEMLYGK